MDAEDVDVLDFESGVFGLSNYLTPHLRRLYI